MATELLRVGPLQTMVQNQVYALPSSTVLLFSSTAAPTFEMSSDGSMGWIAQTAVEGTIGALVGGFIRCTTVGGAVVTLKKFGP
jgi:hypothetical protein